MKLLIEKLQYSLEHIKCLDEFFINNNAEYNLIEIKFNSEPFKSIMELFSKELYAGGKQKNGLQILNRQMILGDIVQYIFSGRAYYFASKNENNLKSFLKLILYSVNQMLILDSITVNPLIRQDLLDLLESKIPAKNLYEKNGDNILATQFKTSTSKLNDTNWKDYDLFVDSLLPKTLGCPKELIVFAELIRLKKGIIIPLLLIQRIFGDKEPIAPPDFLIVRENKEIFGVELGYKKEEQSREFTIRTSIPTFATDLNFNMHNRCQICGEILLYCDEVINDYSEGNLDTKLVDVGGNLRYKCATCPKFNNGNCRYSIYYGPVEGNNFRGESLENKSLHYHAKCIKGLSYKRYRQLIDIFTTEQNNFFGQYPSLSGIESL